MQPPMQMTAYKITTSRNAFGDHLLTTTTHPLPCHFRDMTTTQIGGTNETITTNALIWFSPDAGIIKNDIISVDGVYFKIDSVIKARRLRDSTILFLKCGLIKYGKQDI